MDNNTFLIDKITREYRFYSDVEKKVADYFLENSTILMKQTIAKLSEEIGVSQTTIFKFVKKLGFDGFQDFKISLAMNQKSDASPVLTAYTDITNKDKSIEIANKLIDSNIKSMQYLARSISQEKIDNVTSLIENSEFIHFLGLGGSSVVAYDGYQKFLRTAYRTDFTFDYHLQLMSITKFTNKDIVFIFSHSGQSVETLNLAEKIAETEANLIVLTGNPNTELVKLADESITIYSEESKFRTESLSSRILYLTVMDIIYVNLMYKNEKNSLKSMNKIRSVLAISKNDNNYIL